LDENGFRELRLPPLYDPRMEHDACGVGFIADISGKRTHKLVEDAITAVVNVTHRGAVSADGKSGDGAGVLSQIPEKLFKRELDRLCFRLPEDWRLRRHGVPSPGKPGARSGGGDHGAGGR